MKKLILSLSTLIVLSPVSCSSRGTNAPATETVAVSAGIPEAMQCPGSLDPSQACLGASEPLAPVNNSERQVPTINQSEASTKTIQGRCELMVEGESSAKPCTQVKLFLKGTLDESEATKEGLIDGFNVKFTELEDRSYKVLATSESYDVTTDSRELTPGQIVKIRVKGKPKKQVQ